MEERNLRRVIFFNSETLGKVKLKKTEREKILYLFRIFYLHFYTNFSYENNFKFEDFYNQDLIDQFTKFKILINDVKQFKIFSYSFYEQIIKEINKIDYNRIKLLYQYYNPNSLEVQKMMMEKNKTKNIFEVCKFYFQNININSNGKSCLNFFKIQKLTNKLFKPLISTTERVVDLVLSVNIFYFYLYLFTVFIIILLSFFIFLFLFLFFHENLNLFFRLIHNQKILKKRKTV